MPMPLPTINNQPPEGRAIDSSHLEIIEVFNTIQGEGPHSGLPAVFLRLAGCNIKCPFCDTQYTEGRQSLSLEVVLSKLYDALAEFRCKPILVITGGEPLRQGPALWNLIQLMHEGMFTKIQVETNGTIAWVYEELDTLKALPLVLLVEAGVDVVVSPKASVDDWFAVVSTPIGPSNKSIVTWKYVLSAGKVADYDGLPTSVLGRGMPPHRPVGYFTADQVYIQPADMKDEVTNESNLRQCVESSLKYGYRLSVQVHKIAGLA